MSNREIKRIKHYSDDGINGLTYIDYFISAEEELKLLSDIDKESWNTSLARRTQHYGYIYDYNAKHAAQITTPIPTWCKFVIDRLIEQKIISYIPDQLIVNEYLPGQGIFPHVDNVKSFEDGIVSLSLGSDIIMDFTHNLESSKKKEILLSRLSIIALHRDARYKWRHGITARKTDNKIKRKRRISLTFRKMKLDNIKPLH